MRRSSTSSPTSHPRLAAIACGLLAWIPASVGLQAAPPKLTHLFPAGGQRGSTVVVTCHGDFSWPVSVWAPGVTVQVGEESGKLTIGIPDKLAVDRLWLRLYNAEGASDTVPFLIGSLTEVKEVEPNNARAEAQPIADVHLGVTINGVLEKSGDIDGFAVELAAGQTLVAAVEAHGQLGSTMDGVLQVATPQGTVLIENHDDVGLDPRLAYTATQAGVHIVRVFAFPSDPDSSIDFHGGARYVYRLTLTTGPYITHAEPSTICGDDPDPLEVSVGGWNIPKNANLAVAVFGGDELDGHQELEPPGEIRAAANTQLGLTFARGHGGSARVRIAPHAVTSRLAAPAGDEPIVISPPTALLARLSQPREKSIYEFAATKSDQWVVSVESLGLQSPMVPAVRLLDSRGAVAADSGSGGPLQDVELVHVAAEDGPYRIVVSDRFGAGGQRYFYRLTIGQAMPDFVLTASVDAMTVAKDKPAELEISVKRQAGIGAPIGAIQIEPVDLPPGMASTAVVSQTEGDSATKVKLVITSDGAAYSGPIRIRGIVDQPVALERPVHAPAKLSASFDAIWLTAIAEIKGEG